MKLTSFLAFSLAPCHFAPLTFTKVVDYMGKPVIGECSRKVAGPFLVWQRLYSRGNFLLKASHCTRYVQGDPKQPKSRVATERFLEVVSEIPLWILHENEANS